MSESAKLTKKNRFKIDSGDSFSKKVLEQRNFWSLIKTKRLFLGLIIAVSYYYATELSSSEPFSSTFLTLRL